MIKQYLEAFYFKEGKELLINLDDCVELIKGYEKFKDQEKRQALDLRLRAFELKVKSFVEFKDIHAEFISYWTEMNDRGRKMRFEMQKVFDVKRRLTTWKNNQRNGRPNQTDGLARLREAVSNHHNGGRDSLF